jgi:ABC-type Mn2+/Zn2+ transport system ATPase subunit
MKETSALTVKDLTVELDSHTILESLNFSVESGTTTAIIGPNGAGKSILFKTILGLVPKKSGTIHIFGNNHEKYHQVAPFLSYIPQRLDFDPTFPLTVAGLFSLKSKQLIGNSTNDKHRIAHLLHTVKAAHLLNQRLGTLSGGQLQRILLAYSLMDNPRLLLLDEPAAGIDTQGQETIYPLLARIQKEKNLTMIIISHELHVVMQYANQVLCLNKTILCSGQPSHILSNETISEMYGTPMGHFNHDNHHLHD